MRALAAETIGTFALVFAGTGAIVINHVSGGSVTHVGIGLTFGLIVMAMIYALGDVSGAHFNPAVTFGFFVARQMPGRKVVPYVIAQLLGALLASGAHRLMFGDVAGLGATRPAGSDLQSLLLELILSALLMLVILCVSTGPREIGLMAGIAVGGVVGLEALFAGPISGASMNPARSIAPALVAGNLNHLWIYVAGPVLGAVIAVPCWRLIRPES